MELANAIGEVPVELIDEPGVAAAVHEALKSLILMLTPFAPHTAEELYSVMSGNEEGILASRTGFPEFNEDLAKADEIEVAVQVNGKLRSKVSAPPEASNETLEALAMEDGKIRELVSGKDVVKVIVVPGRLVNIVVKG
jgi:leucyl-tRNA synthetase